MKKNIVYLLIGCLFLLFPARINATDTSHWSFDSHAYEYNMSVYFVLQQAEVQLVQWDEIEIAAFHGDECRGVAQVEEVDGQSTKYYYLRIWSNLLSDEDITFKCYYSDRGKEYVLVDKISFKANERLGFPSIPYLLTVPTVRVTAMELNKTKLSLYVSENEKLIATIIPEDATNKNVIWSIDDESIATITQDGRVTALKVGTAIITVTTEDGGFEAICEIKVLDGVSIDNVAARNINLYPLIVKDKIYINNLPESSMISILDAQGKIIKTILEITELKDIIVDLDFVPKGFYLIRVSFRDRQAVYKIIKF